MSATTPPIGVCCGQEAAHFGGDSWRFHLFCGVPSDSCTMLGHVFGESNLLV